MRQLPEPFERCARCHETRERHLAHLLCPSGGSMFTEEEPKARTLHLTGEEYRLLRAALSAMITSLQLNTFGKRGEKIPPPQASVEDAEKLRPILEKLLELG